MLRAAYRPGTLVGNYRTAHAVVTERGTARIYGAPILDVFARIFAGFSADSVLSTRLVIVVRIRRRAVAVLN